MKKYEVGDLLKCKWHDTLWVVIGMSETCSKHRQKIVILRHSRGITYRNSRYSKEFDLVCRPHSSKTAASKL
jgi:hypothetical protein